MPNNRPTICTTDGLNCVAITGRMHFDGGGYDYHPNTAATVPQRLDNGVNARRARIGVTGKFMGDWNFAPGLRFRRLVGRLCRHRQRRRHAASDSFRAAPLSGLENAYLSYTGFKPFGGNLAIEGGIMDLPYTLDEATSSNDILFMERASVQDHRHQYRRRRLPLRRSARAGTMTRFWAGAYVTGPSTGAIHSASSINPPGTTEQYGVVARARGPARQRQGLLAAPRRRCPMADPAAA